MAVNNMDSKITSAYYDMLSLKRFLLRVQKEPFFNEIISYSVLRDSCLVIFEIYKTIIKDIEILPIEIKEIRNGIKLYRNGANDKIFEEIIGIHVDNYKSYTDNVGFYLKDGDMMGSTIYVEYLIRRLQYLKETND
ncbi:hypothetical protein [Sporosarcina limicola]|uniref:Uncharacterized protein n=1 Tax=Sporosarcina limicola TaxID=34101 RepID=A0A927R7S5_9BACL|nr:hypothetical protein [Sporosarcina limicola]MBE1556289.1 hypothetical protein [Sporosarcina limicola]